MELSIIILNYRSAGLTRQCVKTILLHPPQGSFEVIVVDNDSGDGLGASIAERWPADRFPVRFIQSPANLGFAAGNNLGIAAATGRFVMVLNPDITIRPGAFDGLKACLEAQPDIGVVGPRLVHPDGTLDPSCYRWPTWMIPFYRRTPLGRLPAGRRAVSAYVMDDYDHAQDRDVDWLLGAALMIRREALTEVGTLDERFFLYFEDTDWCRRFKEAGWRVVYHPGAEMVHYHERLSARGSWLTAPLRASTRIHIGSCIKYFAKWGT